MLTCFGLGLVADASKISYSPPVICGALSLKILHHFQNLELPHMEDLRLFQASKNEF